DLCSPRNTSTTTLQRGSTSAASRRPSILPASPATSCVGSKYLQIAPPTQRCARRAFLSVHRWFRPKELALRSTTPAAGERRLRRHGRGVHDDRPIADRGCQRADGALMRGADRRK